MRMSEHHKSMSVTYENGTGNPIASARPKWQAVWTMAMTADMTRSHARCSGMDVMFGWWNGIRTATVKENTISQEPDPEHSIGTRPILGWVKWQCVGRQSDHQTR
jgi:hypothetical protein